MTRLRFSDRQRRPSFFSELTNAQEGEKVATAIKDFVPPDGYEIVPKPARASSNIYKYGLKVKNTDSDKWGFACLGSSYCRLQSKKGVFIAIGAAAASNATSHIAAKHKAGELLLSSSLETKHRRPLCAWYKLAVTRSARHVFLFFATSKTKTRASLQKKKKTFFLWGGFFFDFIIFFQSKKALT